MKVGGLSKKSVFTTVTAIIACGLMLSFSLHTVQINHTHPGDHGISGSHGQETDPGFSVLNEYLHGTEKKLFLMTLIGFLLAGAFIASTLIKHSLFTLVIFWRSLLLQARLRQCIRSFDLFSRLFRKGILNPKLF